MHRYQWNNAQHIAYEHDAQSRGLWDTASFEGRAHAWPTATSVATRGYQYFYHQDIPEMRIEFAAARGQLSRNKTGAAEELRIDSLHFLVGTTHEIEAGLGARNVGGS